MDNTGRYKKYRSSIWPLYRPTKYIKSNYYVSVDDYGEIVLWLGSEPQPLSRKAARLLARRINQALDDTKR